MSFTTFSLTMQDMKTEELGPNSNQQWQNYRVPLPTPSTRAPHTYDQHAPLAAPLISMYQGPPQQDNYSTMSPPHHDMPARRGSETVALSGSSRMHPQAALTSHRSYPTLKRPLNAMEEGHYSRTPPFIQEGMPDTENKPSIQSDHRLLSFSPLPQRTVVLDQYGAQAKIDVAAQIHGMFFLSEMPAHSGDSMIMQPELTCYRRNLFQISGSVSRCAGALSVINERNETVPVVSQELAISAMESVDGHVIRLIVIPWKTPPVNSPDIPAGAEQEPVPIPLDFEGGEEEEKNSAMVTQQISWRRLQFRVATANNGRRKELQQHFVLRLKVMATLADGSKACLNESTTSPIVVRGRSPRNFQARKEIPLVGSSASPRGQTTTVSPSTGKKSSLGPERMGSGSTSIMELPKRQFQFDASSFAQAPSSMRNGFSQWNGPSQHPEQPTGATAPISLPPSSTMAPYMSSIQSFQPIAESSTSSLPPTQAAPLSHQRHYYSSSSSLPQQYDSDERPTKSPRHSYMGNSSTYQNFETPFAAALPSNAAGRGIYYSPVAESQAWAPPPDPSGGYTQALQPQPQHHPAQTHHSAPPLPPPGAHTMAHQHQQPQSHIQQHAHIQQSQHHQPAPQPSQHQGPASYSYTSETYSRPTTSRDDPQNLNTYTWTPPGQ